MKKSILKQFIILNIMLVAVFLSIQGVHAETLQDQMNNLVGPEKQYNTMLSPVYLRNNLTDESISPQSGDLSLAQTDYVLQGRNGLDLEIKRLYKSGVSNVQEMKVEYVNGAWVDYVYSDTNTSSYFEDRFNLGIGMGFAFAGIEVKTNWDGSRHMFLHTESGDTYTLKGPTLIDNVNTYTPGNQTIKDVVVQENTSYSNGQADGTSKYKMVGKDGKKTYFADDGRILGIVDRFGNTIKFEYNTLNYTVDGATKTKKLISKITDTVGRVVTIEYKEDQSFTVGTIANTQYSAEESYKASQNPNSTDSGDLSGKFQVIINVPGARKIVYDKTTVLVSSSKHVLRTRLQRVYDFDGKVKYHFWYEQPDLGFTFINGTSYSVYNRYENLVQIDYSKTNRLKKYSYSTAARSLNDGSMQYRKIFDQKELIKTDFDASKTNFLDRFICDTKDRTTFSYTNEADGFGFAGYNEYDENYLKNTYKYFTNKTDLRGTVTKYTYDGLQELVKTEETGSDHKMVTTTEHDEMKLMKKRETTLYNLVNGQVSGQPLKKIENYRYDEFGDLTNYTGPKAKRDENGYPVDIENTVVYSYAYDRFHTPLLKTWKQDKDTTCQIINTVDAKGNIIREEKVHTDNGNSYITTDFAYDNYGNLTKKIVNSPDNNYISNYAYGIDADGTDQKGAYLTKEYSIVNGIEIAKKHVYDFNTGNVKADIDSNGNRTSYNYDVLDRTVKVTNPDNTTKAFEYNDSINSNSKIIYLDPLGKKFQYECDILGKVIKYSAFNDDKWDVLNSIEYDFKENKTKDTDANGNSIRFDYDSDSRLVKKTFYEKDSVKKESMSINYAFQTSDEAPQIMTIIDEDGYIKKFYYDIQNRLAKTEITPDNVNFYEISSTYDYTGNKLTSTDTRNNTSQFIFDDLGRLIKQIDALGNVTSYEYNSLNKLLSLKEPDNRITKYFYDVLGRTVEERVSLKGSNDYSYKHYSYDGNGNVILFKQGTLKDGIDKISSTVSNTYNSQDRLTDVYNSIDSSRKGHTAFIYDGNGNKTEVKVDIDQVGDKYFKYKYSYDYGGNLIKEEGYQKQDSSNTENGHYITRYTRDNTGVVLTEEKYNGTGYDTTEYSYDYRNRVIEKKEPYISGGASKTTVYAYDKRGNMTSQTQTIQGVSCSDSYTFDGTGKLVKKSDPLGNVTRYVYDSNGNLKKEIDPRYYAKDAAAASGLEYEYDALNRPVKTLVFDGSDRFVKGYKEYDGRGNVVKECDGEGYNASNPLNSTGNKYIYDENNKVVKFISAETHKDNLTNGTSNFTKLYSYDGMGNLIGEEDAYNNKTTYSYYLNGLLKSRTFPDNSQEGYDYDLSGKYMSVVTDKASNKTVTYNSVFEKPYRIEYPDGSFETFDFTSKGEVKESHDRASNTKYFTYDPSGNTLSIKEFVRKDGNDDIYKLTKNTYDEGNKLLSSEVFTDRKASSETLITTGNKNIYIYNKNGKLTRQTGPNGHETINEYDSAGNLVTAKSKVRDGYYDVMRYQYDAQSRVVSEVQLVETSEIDLSSLSNAVLDSEFGSRIQVVTGYEYYTRGQVKSKTDANGNKTSFFYDLDNKLVKRTDSLGNSTNYTFDRNGNLLKEKNAKGVITYYEYDSMGRLIRKKAPAADGSLSVTRYIYDINGNLKKQIVPNNYDETKDTPEEVNSMAGTAYTYDEMNGRITTESPDGQVLSYNKYDPNGNLVKVVDGLRFSGDIESSKGTTYSYDGLGRVLQVIDALGHKTYYEYDVLGNLTKQTDARGNETVYEYNPDNTLVKITYPDSGIMEFTYDKLGRKLSQKDQLGNTTIFSYNGFGKIKSENDPYNNKTEFKYDLNGNITYAKDKRGSTTVYYYDGNNRLVKKKTPLEADGSGNIVYAVENYNYDETGSIIKKTQTGTKDRLNYRETNYTYYDNGLLDTVSDSSGAYSEKFYDKNGNVIKTETLRTVGNMDVQKFEYDNQDRLVKSIKLVDEESIYNAGSLESLKDNEYPGMIKIVTGYAYDLLGNNIKEISPLAYAASDTAGRDKYTVSFSYDLLNRISKVTRKYNGADVSRQYFYDEAGNKIKEIDEKGNSKEFTYDSANRLKSVSDALSNTLTYGYDLAGNKISEKNAKNDEMTYAYDKLNRLVTVTDPYGAVISNNVYDENGNIIKGIDAKGYLSGSSPEARYGIRYAYDLANRLVSVTDREGGNLVYEYNHYGERVKVIDPLGNATVYTYDNGGRLVKVTDPLGINTKYSYDKASNKLSMTDGRGKTTSYTSGAFGISLAVINADGKAVSYKYYLDGSLANITDKKVNNTVYSYDNRGLLFSKKVAETGDSIQYSYDAVGNNTGMIDETGLSTYEYDKLYRLLNIKKGGVAQISYSYDEIGNLETVTDKKGFQTSYTYDKSSRMKTVSFSGNTVTYSYDANGNRDSITYQGGVSEKYTYDKNNRLVTLFNKKLDGSVISKYSYTYDATGKELSKTDSFGKTNYTYDKAGRILGIETPGKTTIYAYDSASNRISLNETYTSNQSSGFIDGTTGNEIEYLIKKSEYVYSPSNELLRLVEKMFNGSGKELLRKTTSYLYDDNGNELCQSVSYLAPSNVKLRQTTKGQVYGDGQAGEIDPLIEKEISTFDGFSRLKKVENVKAGVRTLTEFTYDGDDLRTTKLVKKSDKGYTPETTVYQYDRQHVILECDSAGNVKTRFVRGINYVARMDASSKLSGFLFNGHGDVVQTVSGAGEVENQYDYDVFGNPNLTIEEYTNSIRYAGEFYDVETGLYYLRARYYDPYLGRFVSEDSYWGEDENPLSLNLYSYCSNDPVNFVDPTGHLQSGDQRLTQDVQLQIVEITTQYANTTNLAEKARSHQLAEQLRNNPSNIAKTNETAHDAGFYNAVTNATKDGSYMTASEWNAIKDSFTVAGTVNIASGVSISQVNVASGYSATINNNGTVGTLNTGVDTNVIINNNGGIGNLTTGWNSYLYLNNPGNIGVVDIAPGSAADIYNTGLIGKVEIRDPEGLDYGFDENTIHIGKTTISRDGIIGEIDFATKEKIDINTNSPLMIELNLSGKSYDGGKTYYQNVIHKPEIVIMYDSEGKKYEVDIKDKSAVNKAIKKGLKKNDPTKGKSKDNSNQTITHDELMKAYEIACAKTNNPVLKAFFFSKAVEEKIKALPEYISTSVSESMILAGISPEQAKAGGDVFAAYFIGKILEGLVKTSGVISLSNGAVNTIKTSELNVTHSITMSKSKFKSFVETIKNEGIKEPIKYVEYNGQKYVVDGHHRLQAAKQLGIKDVPVQKVELPYQGYKTVDDLFWVD